MTTAPLLCGSVGFLYVQDGLLTKEDEELPFAGHVVGTLQHFHFVEDLVVIVFVRTQEVVVIVMAIPYEGYELVGWYQDGKLVSTEEEYRFRVSEDIEFTAVFRESTKEETPDKNPEEGTGDGIDDGKGEGEP